MKEKSISVMEEYLSRIYTVVPGLEIIIDIKLRWEFIFDGKFHRKYPKLKNKG